MTKQSMEVTICHNDSCYKHTEHLHVFMDDMTRFFVMKTSFLVLGKNNDYNFMETHQKLLKYQNCGLTARPILPSIEPHCYVVPNPFYSS